MDILSIGLSGLNASRNQALTASNNLANLNTPGYRAQRANGGVSQTPGPMIPSGDASRGDEYVEGSNVDIAEEAVNLNQAVNSTRANAAVVRTGDQMLGTAIDLIG
ncbi:MAG: hypothetical protein GC154_07900 [bacterium]|nr:hypothetical protein [bacterium]